MQPLNLILRISALTALLAGCATQAPQDTTDIDWEQRRQQLQSLTDWSMSGKVAVKTANSADSARLRWRQRGDDLELSLSGPAGLKEVTVTRRDGQLSLLRNGQWQNLAASEEALQREFGWSLPLAYLPWWLKGLPAPGVQATQSRSESNGLAQLQQAGWTLQYLEYQWVQQRWLPARIDFSRDQVRGKILLKQWSLQP